MIGGTLLLATRSAGKLREIRPLLAPLGLHLLDLAEAGLPEESDDELEAGSTFEENALAKARHYFTVSGGIPTVADDSGIEVSALRGQPGVRSKRWSGRTDLSGQALDDANNATLLEALKDLPDRTARYVCVAAFADASGEIVARGETTGIIVGRPRGRGGFGYDPFFLSDDLGVTFGEAAPEEKARVSHRGRAFRQLAERLQELGG
ncbi:MAG TPA: RdgB/HAM1 family non-canonical purine NTP pyrophosphatase [Gemmatimonadaceae bacterium]